MYISTDEQFARTGLVEGEKPTPVVTTEMVNAEAQRLIYEIAPVWVQANLTARGVEFLHKGEENWTEADKKEALAGFALFDQIKAIRAASNVLTALDVIPNDYAKDKHWPEGS